MPDELAFHAPKQERSRRTLERIVTAARELATEHGIEATSVQQIVDRAESSVGSFYARFDGKDDLLRYLERRAWDEARERWDRALAERAWHQLPLADLVTGVVRLLLDVGRHESGVRRALRAYHSGAAGTDPARAFRRHVRQGIRDLLLAHESEMAHPDPSRAVDVGLLLVVGGLRELDETGELEDEDIVVEVSRSFSAYLGSAGSDAEPPGAPVEFFDVWG